jgi:hypothetical protein
MTSARAQSMRPVGPDGDESAEGAESHADRRAAKFRQAAFVYLHVVVLYEAGAWAMWRRGMLPTAHGAPEAWLIAGLLVGLAIVFALLHWKEPWIARVVWLIHGLRLPALVSGAFFPDDTTRFAPSLYLTALVAVMINLWMLARAGWDL